MKQNKWVVYSNGLVMDKVWFSAEMKAEDVKLSLVVHDGYPSTIEVRKSHV